MATQACLAKKTTGTHRWLIGHCLYLLPCRAKNRRFPALIQSPSSGKPIGEGTV